MVTSEEVLLYISIISSSLFILDEFLGWSACTANCITQLIAQNYICCTTRTRDDSTSTHEVIM